MITDNTEYTLKSDFLGGDSERESVLTNAERYAGWTLPTAFPRDTITNDEEMQHDFQSVGAQAVTNLVNKIMMALFQPAKPFFKMELTQEQEEEVGADISKAELDAALAQTERDAMKELNKMRARVMLYDAITQIVIVGNSLIYIPPEDDEKMVTYSLRDFIVKRNLQGDVVKVIIKETKILSGMPESIQIAALARAYKLTDHVSIYTGIEKQGNKFRVWQELEDVCACHEQEGIYTEDTLPWIVLTWNLARGKDYGTGLVESYAGDFHSLSTIAESIVDFVTVATDVKTLVNPTGMTDVKEIAAAKSGDYVQGREEDLATYTADITNSSDFLTARFDSVARRIAAAFLLNTAVTRDAERVTAEEIRMQANELESSLGGVYSRLAADLQTKLAKRLLKRLDPVFQDIEPVIVTGFESLSRNSELGNFRAFMQDLIILADVPEEVRARMEFGDVIATLGAGHGVDYTKFLKDEKKVQQEQQANMAMNAQAAGMEAEAVSAGQQGNT